MGLSCPGALLQGLRIAKFVESSLPAPSPERGIFPRWFPSVWELVLDPVKQPQPQTQESRWQGELCGYAGQPPRFRGGHCGQTHRLEVLALASDVAASPLTVHGGLIFSAASCDVPLSLSTDFAGVPGSPGCPYSSTYSAEEAARLLSPPPAPLRWSFIPQSQGHVRVAPKCNGASLDNVVGTVVSQVSICVPGRVKSQVLRLRCQPTRGDPRCVWGALRVYECDSLPHWSDSHAITFLPGGSYLLFSSARHCPSSLHVSRGNHEARLRSASALLARTLLSRASCCSMPGITTIQRSARPQRWVTPRHAAKGPPSSRSSHPSHATSPSKAMGTGADRGGGILRSFSPGHERSS
ncbi:hypothetical protein NDU88_006988 [Pleurodeles waltl]|uniref:Uncharacterized protein n=1 Tax=Pleurodeles waltl TaxID=8319 RepID=A0AAV7TYF7_PLEWA|nr:hypothetical protein NDU88_006988 [Pleurodeles waltl]